MMLFILYRDGRRKNVRVHTVKKGETLWKIARQYGVPFEDMKRLNAHLANPDYIVPGMELFLPDAPKKELPQKQVEESSIAQPKEQPVVRPKEQPVAPKPKEQPVAKPKEQPVAPKPKEQPIAKPKEQPVAPKPKEQPISKPKEQPVVPKPKEQPIVRPKEQPIKVKEQPKAPPKEMPIPIEEPKPIPHIHPYEEARPVRARIEIIEQHEEEFFIKPEHENKQEPICEPCTKEVQMPAPIPIPTPPPMPMPVPVQMPCQPMPIPCQPMPIPCQPMPIPCQPIVAQPQPCGCGGHQMMQQWPAAMQPAPMMQQWPTQNMAQQWSESMMSPMEEMPMAAPNWNMPESTRECESSIYETTQQQQVDAWQNMPAIPYAQHAESWNFAPPMSYQPMPYQHMMWPGHGHCCSPYPPVHHYPQPQPYYMQDFQQAGNEW